MDHDLRITTRNIRDLQCPGLIDLGVEKVSELMIEDPVLQM